MMVRGRVAEPYRRTSAAVELVRVRVTQLRSRERRELLH